MSEHEDIEHLNKEFYNRGYLNRNKNHKCAQRIIKRFREEYIEDDRVKNLLESGYTVNELIRCIIDNKTKSEHVCIKCNCTLEYHNNSQLSLGWYHHPDLKENPELRKLHILYEHKSRSDSHKISSKKLYEEGRSPLQHLSKDQIRKAHITRIDNLKKDPEKLSERMRHVSLSQSAECRSKAATKSNLTRAKIGNHNFCRAMRDKNPEKWSEISRKSAFTRIERGTLSQIVSKIESNCYDYLKSNFDDSLKSQFLISGVRHAYDMYSPKYNLIIEFDGDFWHRDKKDLDNRYNEIAVNNGYRIFRIRECDYYAKKDSLINLLCEFTKGVDNVGFSS